MSNAYDIKFMKKKSEFPFSLKYLFFCQDLKNWSDFKQIFQLKNTSTGVSLFFMEVLYLWFCSHWKLILFFKESKILFTEQTN